MAAPVDRQATSFSSGSSDPVLVTLGSPALAGSVITVNVTTRQNTIPTPAGWVLLRAPEVSNSAESSVLAYRAAGGETSFSFPVTVTGSSVRISGNCVEWTGCAGTTIEDAFDVAAGANSGNTFVAAQSSGTTALTAVSDSISLGNVSTDGTTRTFDSVATNDFVILGGNSNPAGGSSTGVNSAIYVKTLSATASQETTMSWPGGTSRSRGTMVVLKGTTSAPTGSSGTLEASLGTLTAASAGEVLHAADMTCAPPPLIGSVAGEVTSVGHLVVVLPLLAAEVLGATSSDGSLAFSLPHFGADLQGLVTHAGVLNATIPVLTSTSQGALTIEGAATSTLPVLAAAAAGGLIVESVLAASLPGLTAEILTSTASQGALTSTLPSMSAAVAGSVLSSLSVQLSWSRVQAPAPGDFIVHQRSPTDAVSLVDQADDPRLVIGVTLNDPLTIEDTVVPAGTVAFGGLAAALPPLSGAVGGAVNHLGTISGAIPRLTASVDGFTLGELSVQLSWSRVQAPAPGDFIVHQRSPVDAVSLVDQADDPRLVIGVTLTNPLTLGDEMVGLGGAPATSVATFAATLPALSASMAGTAALPEALVVTLPALTAQLHGYYGSPPQAVLQVALPALTAAAAGQVISVGQLGATLGRLTVSLQGTSDAAPYPVVLLPGTSTLLVVNVGTSTLTPTPVGTSTIKPEPVGTSVLTV